MNTRIQQIVDEASAYPLYDNGSMLFEVWKTRYTEKLIELIVRECIHIAYDRIAVQKTSGVRASTVCDAIKEHFGVKE